MTSARMGTGRKVAVTILGVIVFLLVGMGVLWWYDRNVADISFFGSIIKLAWGAIIFLFLALIVALVSRR